MAAPIALPSVPIRSASVVQPRATRASSETDGAGGTTLVGPGGWGGGGSLALGRTAARATLGHGRGVGRRATVAPRRAVNGDAVAVTGGASALDMLVGAGALLAIGRAGVRALPVIKAADDDAGAGGEDGGDDDTLGWGVAGVVSALPLVGFMAWCLPAMLPSEETDASGSRSQAYLGFAALYFVAFASHGFDPSDGAVWAFTAACAVHFQLERAAAAAETTALEATPRTGSAGSVARAAVESKEDAGSEEGADPRGWSGGADPLAGVLSRATLPKLPVAPQPPKIPEVPELTVKELGRALGVTQLKAAELRGEVQLRAAELRGEAAQGRLQALIEAQDREEQSRLEREAASAADEKAAWDARFELRTMTKDGLLNIARERGMRGYSKLRRAELLEAVELELYGEEK